MRSDFYGLPYAAQRAIRRGESAAHTADHLSRENDDLLAALEAAREALRDADAVAWEVAIMLTHSDPERKALAKERLFAWRDRNHEALSKIEGVQK